MSFKNDNIIKTNKFVGSKIFYLRMIQNITRKQLAQEIGVSQQQLIKYEAGTNRISVGRLVLIAHALSKEISYFFDGLESIKLTNKKAKNTSKARKDYKVRKICNKIAV